MRELNPNIFKVTITVAAVVCFFCVAAWPASGEEEQGQFKAARVEPTRTLEHTAQALSLGFSPDGKLLTTGSIKSRVRLWDLATGEVKLALSLRTGQDASGGGTGTAAFGVAISPDSKTLVAGGDAFVRFWDIESGKLLRTIDCPKHSGVMCLALSPDGKLLATGTRPTTWPWFGPSNPLPDALILWDVKTGERKQSLMGFSSGHCAEVNAVAFSPDGKKLASGSQDGTIRQWNVETGEQIHSFERERCVTWSLAFSPDGSKIASGSFIHQNDENLPLTSVVTVGGEPFHEMKLVGRGAPHVAFSPDGKTLATAWGDDIIRLLDVETWELKHTLQFEGMPMNAKFSPDGTLLAVCGGGTKKGQPGTVMLWDIKTLKPRT